MSRSHLLAAGEIVFVTIVVILTVTMFHRSAPPEAGAVGVELKLPDSRAQVYLQRESNGSMVYLIRHGDGSIERLPAEKMAENLYKTEKANATAIAVDIHNPSVVFWLGIGLVGQLLFTGRMVVQWIASERQGKSVVPALFWWMSLVGSLLLLSYFLWRRDPIGLLGQAFGSFVYLKNILWILGESRQAGVAAAGAQP